MSFEELQAYLALSLKAYVIDEHAALQLNLFSTGHLATTQLGTQILREAVLGAAIACARSILGSIISLAMSLVVPQTPIVGVILTVALLGALGWILAVQRVRLSSYVGVLLDAWGITVCAIGIKLNILG